MPWKPEFAIGHDLIDAQHQELFLRLDALLAATARGDRSEVEHTVNFLLDYVETHFSAEEALMAERGYPDLDLHLELHGEFRRDLAAMEREIHDAETMAGTANDLGGFVSQWLIDHILEDDQAFARFLEEN